MTPEERQRLSQFASDNGLCITMDGDSIVDIADNEPWPSREEVLGYPSSMDAPTFTKKPATRRLEAPRNERRKANKAARKARRNRR